MIPFANTLGLWALLLLPALIAFALIRRALRFRTLGEWGGGDNVRKLSSLPSREWDMILGAMLWVALGLGLVAFARPQWGEVAEDVQRVGLDLVVCLDTSRSMSVVDVSPSRMERAKLEVRSLVAALEGDRVALVCFAGVPIALSPLTEDTSAVNMLLDIADDELIPAQGTDLGKAIAESIKLLPQPHERDQLILLVSDGEDQGNEGVTAARVAARLGIRVFCVGVGTAHGGLVPGPDRRPLTDPTTGGQATSRLDEQTLRQIAAISDGRYWTLTESGSVVPQLIEEIGRLKRKEYASRSQAMRQDQYAWFLGPAALLLLLVLLLPDRRRLPWLTEVAKRRVRYDATRQAQALKKPAAGSSAAQTSTVILALLGFLIVPTAARASSPEALAEEAQAAYTAGHYEAALTLYRSALQEAATPALKPLLHFDAGTCLLALKRGPEARDELTLALGGAEALLRSRSLYNLAQALYDCGDTEKALSALRLLLADEPSNRDAQLLYEWILRNKPPEPPEPPPDKNPPPPRAKPPDLLEQLPMPPPKELQDQLQPPNTPPPGMKPW